jgi:hypothetical protein
VRFEVGKDGGVVVAALERATTRPARSNETQPLSAVDDGPRVLNLRAGAKYLGISYWSLRDLVLAGHVPAVRLPCPRAHDGRMMRRVLVDRRDLDALIERSRERNA